MDGRYPWDSPLGSSIGGTLIRPAQAQGTGLCSENPLGSSFCRSGV